MKYLIYIAIILFTVQMNGQNTTEKRNYTIKLLTVEKTNNDTIIGAIIEAYTGGKRIQADVSDFFGNTIFILDSKNIVDNKIRLKIYGPRCSIYEKEYYLTENLDTKINLEYGETEYNHISQMGEMLDKLNIVFEDGEE